MAAGDKHLASLERARELIRRACAPQEHGRYTLERRLGGGAFGEVFLAWDAETSAHVALKVIRTRDADDVTEAIKEARIMASIADLRRQQQQQQPHSIMQMHRMLAPLVAPSDDCDNKANGAKSKKPPRAVVLSLEYCKAGTLHDEIAALRKAQGGGGFQADVGRVRVLASQLLGALAFLHDDMGIVHRDVKPSNIMMHGDPGRGDLKVGDMGACLVMGANCCMRTRYYVTRWYRPPELWCDRDERCSGFYDFKVDVWSAACVIAEMLLGRILFPCSDATEFSDMVCKMLGKPDAADLDRLHDRGCLSKMLRTELACARRHRRHGLADVFPSLDADAADLLTRMLSIDPAQRPSAAECLSHRFFSPAPALVVDTSTVDALAAPKNGLENPTPSSRKRKRSTTPPPQPPEIAQAGGDGNGNGDGDGGVNARRTRRALAVHVSIFETTRMIMAN